jgi:simple sugar transport system permease protein
LALLKTKLKVDDVVSTLLLNYVMIHIMGALLFGPLQQPGSSWPRSSAIIEAAQYPVLLIRSRFHMGILIAFLAVFVVWFINKKTTFGYQSKALISGGLAGLAGVGELCAIQYRLIMDISPGYGYSGIVIAMLGNLHPVGVLFSTLFFSVIIVGAQSSNLYRRGYPGYGADGDAHFSAFYGI